MQAANAQWISGTSETGDEGQGQAHDSDVAPTAVECSCMHRVPPSEIVRFEVSGQQTAGRVRKLEPGPVGGWSEREREIDR